MNYEISFIVTKSDKCVLSYDTKATAPAITNTNVYFPVAILSTRDNEKLLQQFKSSFKRTIKWNRHQSIVPIQAPDPKHKCSI